MARLWDAIRESSSAEAPWSAGRATAQRVAAKMTVRVTVWNEFRQERPTRR